MVIFHSYVKLPEGTVFGMMHGFLRFPTFSVLSSLLGGSSLSYFCEDLQFSLKHRAGNHTSRISAATCDAS